MSSPYTPYPQGGDEGGYGQPYPQGDGGWEPGTPRGYLQGAPVGFGEAVSQAFRNVLTFNGRASRSAFWWFFLVLAIFAIVVDIIAFASGARALEYLVQLIVILANLALQVRRLHDTDRSGFWCFIYIIPVVGFIVLVVFDCLPGTPRPNRFG
ncbi:MAG TPA: DUF805 domain-containing protein [Trebonia sp.]|nr:DUF805 domain-containing protein [Trebonia sp.]